MMPSGYRNACRITGMSCERGIHQSPVDSPLKGPVTQNFRIQNSNQNKLIASHVHSFGHIYIIVFSGTMPAIHNTYLPCCPGHFRSPIENQWGSLKCPGQSDRYD